MNHDIFRRWYIDGKIYYHTMVDSENLKVGIQELRMIDPTMIRKIKEVTKKRLIVRPELKLRKLLKNIICMLTIPLEAM